MYKRGFAASIMTLIILPIMLGLLGYLEFVFMIVFDISNTNSPMEFLLYFLFLFQGFMILLIFIFSIFNTIVFRNKDPEKSKKNSWSPLITIILTTILIALTIATTFIIFSGLTILIPLGFCVVLAVCELLYILDYVKLKKQPNLAIEELKAELAEEITPAPVKRAPKKAKPAPVAEQPQEQIAESPVEETTSTEPTENKE